MFLLKDTRILLIDYILNRLNLILKEHFSPVLQVGMRNIKPYLTLIIILIVTTAIIIYLT